MLPLDPDDVAEVVRPQTASGVDRATFRRGEYGRIVRPDGTEQWWVRSARGTWTALSHQRVMENDDGTITLLSLM
jgi:predicted lipoprotein with Yx(FWY)xxD motif